LIEENKYNNIILENNEVIIIGILSTS